MAPGPANALFVAIPLPTEVTSALDSLRPARGKGVRAVPSDRMHLTLHYLGPVAAEPVIERLAAVRAGRFDLRLAGTGAFGNARRGAVLWVGVEPDPPLLALHRAILEALDAGEQRPFRPHVTLARCRPPVDPALLAAHRRGQFSATFRVDACVLFASHPAPHGPPEYRIRMTVPLNVV